MTATSAATDREVGGINAIPVNEKIMQPRGRASWVRNDLIRYRTLGSDDREWWQWAARMTMRRLSLPVQVCALP